MESRTSYDGINDEIGGILIGINDACLGIFLVELAIRITAYGGRPQDFSRRAGTSSTSS